MRARFSVFAGAAASFLLVACPGEPPPAQPRPQPIVAGAPVPPPRTDGRLTMLATPRGYAVDIDVDPTKERFTGTVRIDVDVPAPTSFVILHGRALAIHSAHAVMPRTAPVDAQAQFRMATGALEPEELVLTFARPLPAGHAQLVIEYDAPFDDSLSGLYRFQDADKWYAVTQGEATYARRYFPCFDEPAFKTPFDLSVTVPNGMLAVANTAETMREPNGNNKTRFRFKRTLPLPTYLLAFVVGDLAIDELKDRTTKPAVRIVSTNRSKAAANLDAMKATGALIDLLGQWFGIPYPYDKLDVVSLPAFSAGAMENPGLVTFRDDILLVDPARASTNSRREQAIVIAHELAHQWFGDLVTANWWNDIWLNEGMATWMESHVADMWHPEWGARIDAVQTGLDVMDTDGLAAARAVRQPAVTNSDIEEAFDGITYEKGAAVLQTIENWIGEYAFQKGIRDYLVANANQSVDTKKLFDSFSAAAKKDVGGFASGYLDQPGVPEVTAETVCDTGGRWHIELGSRTWRPLGSSISDDDSRAWNIPVCVRTDVEKAEQCVDMIAGAPSLVAGRGACPKMVHPNVRASYYRFSMPARTFVATAQGRAQLEIPQRLSLLSNAWSSVRAGDLEAKALLDILPPFDAETARQPIGEELTILQKMANLVDDETKPAFKKFALARLAARKKAIGWEGKTDDPLVRQAVLYAMADVAEDDATLKEADDYARKWLNDPSSVSPDIAVVAVDIGSRRADDARIPALVAAMKSAKTLDDRDVALRALGGFEDPTRLGHALDRALTDDLRANEIGHLIGAAMRKRSNRPYVDKWVRAHWDELKKKLPGALGNAMIHAAAAGCSPEEAADAQNFYGKRAESIEGAVRGLREILEGVQLCAALKSKATPSLHKALVGPAKK